MKLWTGKAMIPGGLTAALAFAVATVTPVLAQEPGRVKVFIGFPRQPGPAEEALVRSAGGAIKYTYHVVPAIAASLPEAAIERLRRNPNVTAIELDEEVQAVDAELDSSWGVKRIGAGAVHDRGNNGFGVKIAVIDTGVDYNHPDLDANFVGGHDFVNGDTDPLDDNGHGTHVAGTVLAEDNGSGVVGVAPEADLYALKVLDAGGSGFWSDIVAAVQWAVDNGMQITNNSYGGRRDPGSIVQAAFDNSFAAGVLHIAAAGNSGRCFSRRDNVSYPARFDSVVAVAAIDESDRGACFSGTGPAVELSAPGVDVNSVRLGEGYVELSGTSMASPHVAGTAALVMAAGIPDTDGDGHLNKEVRKRLQETADDLGPAGRDAGYGFGLVDADEAARPPF